MAYIGAADVKLIREALKAAFPEFKFGVRKGDGGYSVDVTIKSGPLDLSADCHHGEGYSQINQYYLGNYEYSDLYEAIIMLMKRAPSKAWYDNSDSMTDYFDTAYYIHLNVGSWNKPYEMKLPRNSRGIYHRRDYLAEAQTAIAITKLAA